MKGAAPRIIALDARLHLALRQRPANPGQQHFSDATKICKSTALQMPMRLQAAISGRLERVVEALSQGGCRDEGAGVAVGCIDVRTQPRQLSRLIRRKEPPIENPTNIAGCSNDPKFSREGSASLAHTQDALKQPRSVVGMRGSECNFHGNGMTNEVRIASKKRCRTRVEDSSTGDNVRAPHAYETRSFQRGCRFRDRSHPIRSSRTLLLEIPSERGEKSVVPIIGSFTNL